MFNLLLEDALNKLIQLIKSELDNKVNGSISIEVMTEDEYNNLETVSDTTLYVLKDR